MRFQQASTSFSPLPFSPVLGLYFSLQFVFHHFMLFCFWQSYCFGCCLFSCAPTHCPPTLPWGILRAQQPTCPFLFTPYKLANPACFTSPTILPSKIVCSYHQKFSRSFSAWPVVPPTEVSSLNLCNQMGRPLSKATKKGALLLSEFLPVPQIKIWGISSPVTT